MFAAVGAMQLSLAVSSRRSIHMWPRMHDMAFMASTARGTGGWGGCFTSHPQSILYLGFTAHQEHEQEEGGVRGAAGSEGRKENCRAL